MGSPGIVVGGLKMYVIYLDLYDFRILFNYTTVLGYHNFSYVEREISRIIRLLVLFQIYSSRQQAYISLFDCSLFEHR